MNILWSVNNMPELASLSENERQNIAWASLIGSFNHWQSWVASVVIMLCGIVGAYFGNVIGAALGGGIGGCVCAPVIVGMQAREVRQAVARREKRLVSEAK